MPRLLAALLAVVALTAGTAHAQGVPGIVGGNFAIRQNQWVAVDYTTTIAEDGTWMAVGPQADVWIVMTPASNPRLTFLGYLSAANIAAAQPPVGPPPDPTAPTPTAPRRAPRRCRRRCCRPTRSNSQTRSAPSAVGCSSRTRTR